MEEGPAENATVVNLVKHYDNAYISFASNTLILEEISALEVKVNNTGQLGQTCGDSNQI